VAALPAAALSKKYLAGALERERLDDPPGTILRRPPVQALLGRRVTEIVRREQRLRLDDDTVLAYDALLLATGSRPRRLAAPGTELAGVHFLRTIAMRTASAPSAPREGAW